jgi:spore maturation protein CgeB
MTAIPPKQIRLLVLGAKGRHKTEASIARAARSLGHRCRVLDVAGWHRRLGDAVRPALEWAARSYEPDLIVCTRHALLLGVVGLRRLISQRHAVFWYFDAVPTEQAFELGRIVERMYVTYAAEVPVFRAAGVPDVKFLPQALDPREDYPAASAPPSFRCDVSFVGSGPYPYRWELLRAIAGMCTLQIRGPGWQEAPADLPVAGGEIRGRRFAEAVHGATISLDAHAVPPRPGMRASASNRMWKVLGCGGFLLAPRVAGIQAFAREGEHCLYYGDTTEALDAVRWALAHPEERARLAAAGRSHALGHHTYAHRLKMLIEAREYPLDGAQPAA